MTTPETFQFLDIFLGEFLCDFFYKMKSNENEEVVWSTK